MRDKKIDLCKGIGILLVVLGHAGMPHSSLLFRFHMALFFFVSGYLFNDSKVENIQNLGRYIERKIKSLYLPFVIWNGLLVLFNNAFIATGIYTDNPLFLEEPGIVGAAGNWFGIKNALSMAEIFKILKQVFLFEQAQQLGGASWFLRVMFGVSVLWGVWNYIIKKISHNSRHAVFFANVVMSVALLILSNMCQRQNINMIMQFETVASSYIMFCIGYYFKKIIECNNGTKNKCSNALKIFAIGFSFICLICCDNVCNLLEWNSNVNNYNYWPMYITSSLSGFLVVFLSSDLLIRVKNTVIRKMVHLLSDLGKHSIYILLLHFLSFKIISGIQLLAYHQPLYRLASFPCFINGGLWWMGYTIAGVALPVLIGHGIDWVKSKVKRVRLG